ncbi:hypothetical protein [Dyella choica]|uniref:Uncharacterized protein n=1 Tax=Dyella choica TaxID=1927959 RepID=A0A3S0PNM4_9GAMM|nr:hypothetical protein [Dyella choica]RUL77612.1 hypothetical protein EKH80_06970 [Dyella choica]
MTTTKLLAEAGDDIPTNVVPFRRTRSNLRGLGARSFRSRGVQVRPSGPNAVELEPAEQRLARRVERVLAALLYHALLEPGDLLGAKPVSVEKRISRLVSHDRLIAIARAAISHDLTDDLARLAAAVIVFELKTQSRWWNRMLRLVSVRRRQINDDSLAIARLLAWDMAALQVRLIDQFAAFL